MAGFTINSVEQLLRERDLQPGGQVQKFIDNECMRLMAKYTPHRTGNLILSAKEGTVISTGVIHQTAPYARRNYYHNAGRGTEGTAHGGLRGKYWFERMKAAHKNEILDEAAKLCGAKPEGG